MRTESLFDFDWVMDAFTAAEPPPPPLAEPWKLSLGTLIAGHRKPPMGTGKLLGLLDRLGAIEVGPQRAGFDGDLVEWGKITEIRTVTISDLLVSLLLDDGVDRVADYLPPVPGRKWVAGQAAGLSLTLWMALLSDDALFAEPGEEDADKVVVPYELVHGRKTVTPGSLSSTFLALGHPVGGLLLTMAEQAGITVTEKARDARFSTAIDRAAWLRERRAALTPAETPALDS